MNIEKCECDRLGYEYRDLLEQVVSVLHHIPYAKDYISEERVDKLYKLVIKLATGDCEIIEFKRKLCRYDVTEKIDEQDKQIQELTNNWNNLEKYIKERIEEFKNAGKSRKEIKAHQYYMLLCDIEKILNSSL